MWRSLLGASKPAAPEEPPKEEKAELPPKPHPPKETIGVPKQSETSSSGFFEPPKLPPSPRTLTRKKQQEAAKSSPLSTETKTTTETTGEENPITPDGPPANQAEADRVAQGTWSPPSSARSHLSSPKKQSQDSISEMEKSPRTPNDNAPKDPHWAASPAAGERNAPEEKVSLVTSETELVSERRDARIRYANFFKEGIDMIEAERKKEMENSPSEGAAAAPPQNDRISVFVRKRPLDENEKDDYDIIRVELPTPSNPVVVVYNTLMDPATKTRTIKPITFGAAAVFDEHNNSADVYYRAVRSLVEKTKNGGIATLLMYGQSGTGKTHTMTTIQGMAARDIFTGLPPNYTVKVSFVEICGKQCFDLLDETPSAVRIADNEDGSVRFVNARLVTVSAPEDLQDAIVNAKKRRQFKSSETAGGASSLSHAVCRICVVPCASTSDEAGANVSNRPGTLTLVDCAGTERRVAKVFHDRRNQAKRAEINASLWALKQCIRAASQNRSEKNLPYNYSSLTRILRESLESRDASFHVVATVSAKATDTEHTIDTLLTVANVVEGSLDELTAEQEVASNRSQTEAENIPPPPKAWDHPQLCSWLMRKHLVPNVDYVPEEMTGRKIMRMSKKELQECFYGDSAEKADLLYRCLRAEMDRIARLDVKRRMAIELAARKGEVKK